MALANFFDRASQSLRQILRGVDSDFLAERLNGITVAVAFDDGSVFSPSRRATLEMAVNLLSRLYPKIAIIHQGNSDEGREMRSELIRLALSINPAIEIIDPPGRVAATLCVGDANPASEKTIWVHADSWNVEVRVGRPISSLTGDAYNPISSAVAACFGAAEIFAVGFGNLLPTRQERDRYLLSLLDYSRRPSPSMELSTVHLEDLALVGLGAVGNAVVWCLRRIPNLTGMVHLVDHEQADLSNLQRYVLTDQASPGMAKTDLAAMNLVRNGLDVFPYPLKLGNYARDVRGNGPFDTIAISVDNRCDRIVAQALLPRLALNAWTDGAGRLGVSRHWFDGFQACLACMYMESGRKKSETDLIAESTGLPPKKVIELVVKKIPLSVELLSEIAAAKRCPTEVLMKWVGGSIQEFYTEAVCGGVILEYSKGSEGHEALVPLAHQSVLAGALLAGEIVKTALKLVSREDPAETKMDVLSPPQEYLSMRRSKTVRPNCICTDEDYLEVYRIKYGQ
jgi:molybdopterin/thiamine biosynthesis adenylyltransferase